MFKLKPVSIHRVTGFCFSSVFPCYFKQPNSFRIFKASLRSIPSCSCTNCIKLPLTSQPKQWNTFLSVFMLKLGLVSWWKIHGISTSLPAGNVIPILCKYFLKAPFGNSHIKHTILTMLGSWF